MQLQTEMQTIFSGRANFSQLESCYRQLIMASPQFESNPFERNPFIVGVKNGVLFLTSDSVEFKDYGSISCPIFHELPIVYDPNICEKPLFDNFMRSILGGSADFDEKLLAVQQMFGACLFSVYPRLFMIYGPAQTGKSTLLGLVKAFASSQNVGSVEPHQMDGFLLESLMDKNVNIVTDIDPTKGMNESLMKRIEDRVPQLVNRKNRPAILASLPVVHIFAGNQIPLPKDAISGAHLRRWTFLELNNKIMDIDRRIVEKIMFAEASAILNFAINGAKSLIKAGGAYTQPPSSLSAINSWQDNSLIVGKFVGDLTADEHGSYGLVLDSRSFVAKRDFYNAFRGWCDDTGYRQRLSDTEILRQVRALGYDEVRTSDTRGIAGFRKIIIPL
jgi:phage/plasmid-associated DNA primase